jgi:SAM-dependent methyltransferase
VEGHDSGRNLGGESNQPRSIQSTDWEVVDRGWGRKAVDFSTLSEPANCREYVDLQHRLGISDGDRVLDIACGAGLALELAGVQGAACAGIDASARLVAVARDRSPGADVRVGDMHHLPWVTTPLMSSPASEGYGGPRLTCSARFRESLFPTAEWGSRFGATSRHRRELGPSRRSGWPPRRK